MFARMQSSLLLFARHENHFRSQETLMALAFRDLEKMHRSLRHHSVDQYARYGVHIREHISRMRDESERPS